jgi:nucleoside-diphosphate-sugar epimerase
MENPVSDASALVIGAGYLARFLVERLPGDCSIVAVRRSAAPTAGTSRVVPLACDVTSDDAARVLAPALRRFDGPAFFLLPPTGLAAGDPAQALAPLFSVLLEARVRRVVVASSTGIYDEADGATVSAATRPSPASPRAKRLADIEQAWRGSGVPCRIVRLAGLYGPGRIIGRGAILAGDTLPGDPEGWLNLVRAEDAAAALLAAARTADESEAYLVSDGTPVRRGDYYSCLAQLLGRPLPPFDPAQARRGASRRCDPSDSWARLGLEPRYPDYRSSLGALLAGAG